MLFFLIEKLNVASKHSTAIFDASHIRNKVHSLEVISPGLCIMDLAVPFCCCDPAVAQKCLDVDQVSVGCLQPASGGFDVYLFQPHRP